MHETSFPASLIGTSSRAGASGKVRRYYRAVSVARVRAAKGSAIASAARADRGDARTHVAPSGRRHTAIHARGPRGSPLMHQRLERAAAEVETVARLEEPDTHGPFPPRPKTHAAGARRRQPSGGTPTGDVRVRRQPDTSWRSPARNGTGRVAAAAALPPRPARPRSPPSTALRRSMPSRTSRSTSGEPARRRRRAAPGSPQTDVEVAEHHQRRRRVSSNAPRPRREERRPLAAVAVDDRAAVLERLHHERCSRCRSTAAGTAPHRAARSRNHRPHRSRRGGAGTASGAFRYSTQAASPARHRRPCDRRADDEPSPHRARQRAASPASPSPRTAPARESRETRTHVVQAA